MNFQGKAVLVYLEEDNIARAYFRIRPLLTQDGPVGDMLAAYPDDGCLRIVPDKNEQHTFKERMRAMCGLCLLDLRTIPPEANKIRTNKNYSPSRGETNQYIVYSDAVCALPDDLIYQVVSESQVQTAATPFVYIRNGANIQGPFRREDGQPQGDTAPLPPDSAEIHAVTVAGQDLLFYWHKQAEAPAAEEQRPAQEAAVPETPVHKEQNAYEQIQSMNEGLSEHANRLHESAPVTPMDFMPDQPQKPLTGTRLYQAPQKTAAPRRAHNALMEAVESQRYAARYEAPGATLSQSAELKEVQNPASALKYALQDLCQTPEGRRQAVDALLDQPGIRPMLSTAISQSTNDLTVAAMQGQLQELEAERLMTLMQLDDVKKNLSAAREEALGALTQEEQKKLDALNEAQKTAQAALDQLQSSLAPIEEKRRQLAEELQRLENAADAPVHLVTPRMGAAASREALIARTEEALRAAGFLLEPGDAPALLTAFALARDEWQFCCDTASDAQTAFQAFAAALGVPMEAYFAPWETIVLPGGNAPVLLDGMAAAPHPLALHCAAADYQSRKAEYGATVPSVPFFVALDALPSPLPVFEPVSKESIASAMIREEELADDTKVMIASLRQAMLEAGRPLPLQAVEMLCRFIASTQNECKGGVAEAIDRGVCLYALPYLTGDDEAIRRVRPLLAAMPRTLKTLNR